MARVDYDAIAHLYDEPIRDHAVDPRLIAFLAGRDHADRGRPVVLDVGCGTGKQLASDGEDLPDARLIGVDRSRGMLRIAQQRCPDVAWIQGDAALLPLSSSSVDYATSQFSYQHIGRTRQLLADLFRVLKPGGRFVMTNIDPWSMPDWHVYQYFPDALDVDRRDFLRPEVFADLMRDVGFVAVTREATDLSRDEDLRGFLAYASGRHRASQFSAIPGDRYAWHLQRLRETVERAAGQPLPSRSQFVLLTMVGDKPRSAAMA